MAPEYDWVEIADGLGEQLNISDSGNGNGSYQNGTVVLDLPFIFTFYGEDVQIKVQRRESGRCG